MKENKLHPFKAKIISLIGKSDGDVTDDEIFDAANSKMDELEQALANYKSAVEELDALVQSDPLLGAILEDFKNGASFAEALGRHVAPEDIIPAEGSPDYEKWNASKSERLNRLKTIEENKSNFIKNVDEFIAENNLTEEEATNLLSAIDDLINKALNFSVDKNDLKKFYAAINDIQEVKSKAEKLNEINAETQDAMGDGVPSPSSTPSGEAMAATKKVGLYDWVRSKNL